MKLIEKKKADDIMSKTIFVTTQNYLGNIYELDNVQYLETEDGDLYEIDAEEVESDDKQTDTQPASEEV